MKMIEVLLVVVALASTVSAATTVAAGGYNRKSYSVTSSGYCYEVTSSSGTASVFFNNNGIARPNSYTSTQSLANGGTVYYYEPQNWGAPITLSVDVVAPASAGVTFSVFTSDTNPCDPNPCTYQYLCVPKPQCTYSCDLVPTYDCASNSPCTAANIAAGLFYFANTDGQKYVHCGGVGICNVQTCGKLYWSQQLMTCVPAKK